MIMKRIMNDKQDLLKLDEIIFSGFNGAKAQEMEWKLPVLKLHERTRISPELKKATKEILKGYAKYKLAEARLKDLENGKDSDQEKIAAIRKEVEDWEKANVTNDQRSCLLRQRTKRFRPAYLQQSYPDRYRSYIRRTDK